MSEIGLIGKKIGMTREFFKTGQSIPVTVTFSDKFAFFSKVKSCSPGRIS